jgi:hypothetical protein
MCNLAQVFGGREGLGRGWVAGGCGSDLVAICVCTVAIAVGRAGYAPVPERPGGRGHASGKRSCWRVVCPSDRRSDVRGWPTRCSDIYFLKGAACRVCYGQVQRGCSREVASPFELLKVRIESHIAGTALDDGQQSALCRGIPGCQSLPMPAQQRILEHARHQSHQAGLIRQRCPQRKGHRHHSVAKRLRHCTRGLHQIRGGGVVLQRRHEQVPLAGEAREGRQAGGGLQSRDRARSIPPRRPNDHGHEKESGQPAMGLPPAA